ncbi:MAG: EAL domain-containing protein [Verrucomicrobia bacterium]|nr:EAL domain-containing protein [Verrucomicrobiota bacterium]
MKVLIIEDDPVTSLILRHLLTERAYDVTACATAEEAMKICREAVFPLLFMDLYLPGMDGFSFCRWLRNQPAGDQPVILVGTASDRTADLQKILEAGADDYIVKPYDKGVLDVRLVIAQQLVKNREIKRSLEENLQQERERLKYLATHDPLTKLLNRAAFVEKVQNSVQAARFGGSSALLYVDLDNFKLINDSLGHAAGDSVLAEVATLLQESVRDRDVPGRFGGDEFGVLLEDVCLPEAKAIGQRILSRMEELHFSDSGRAFLVGSSIGLVIIDGTVPAEVVIACADSACYGAKVRGRNRVEVYDGYDGAMTDFRDQAPRAAEIKDAIRAQSFEILFQPIVDVQTTNPVLYEVLVRLPSQGKLLLPSHFLPAAERFHLMPEIDRQVITKALKHLVKDHKLRLAINLSGQSFGDRALPDFIGASFNAAGVEPDRVTFEITETAVISNLPAARTMMHQLHGAGFRFALDDFGAGFSSFSYLKDLIADYLKIDGNFVHDAERGHSDWIFVELMNEVAHRLKIKSIAEFVEQEATLAKLRAIGVDLAQGYLFGMPSPLP